MSRILVIDDEQIVLDVMVEILRSAGHEADGVVSFECALSLLQETDYALVVSDIVMPGHSGLDVLERIHALLPSLPVVLVTALGAREDRERGLDAGANAYIVKGSFDQGDLLDAVRRLA